jgi:hypothetical protein
MACTRLVSTLEPLDWETGFKVCFQVHNLYRYTRGLLDSLSAVNRGGDSNRLWASVEVNAVAGLCTS